MAIKVNNTIVINNDRGLENISNLKTVAGRNILGTGDITLSKSDVGLSNVNNTADANKPVSTAQQTALDLKANIASPALTGTPTAPTAIAGTNTTQLATTGFVIAERSTAATLTNKTISGGTVNPSTLQENSTDVVVQTDIGSEPNQIPLNQHLGSMAYQNLENVIVENLTITGTANLPDIGVTAGTYGSTSTIPVLSVDAKGRVISAQSVSAASLQGYTGSQGAQGVIGFTGSQGTQGVTGFTGSTGATGATGFTGSQGIPGVIGYTGSQGATGTTGATGFTGSQGATGTTGFTGSQGTQGVIGYTGSQGIIGFTGSQGIQGVTGFTGSQGATGFTGSQGATGFTGSQGATGFTGSQGATGATGFTGSQGIQGVIGFTGSQGTQGVIGYTGSQGATGFTGSQGATGATGATGFTGSQGIQGVTGFTGSQGATGTTGFTGSQGTTGATGFTGSQGATGATGFTGSASTVPGPTGFTGSQGAIGYTGSASTQMITISGDASGSGVSSISLTLASTGVAAGTYKSVTVDAKGRVTAATNPTTLSGYGITDAVTTSGVNLIDGTVAQNITAIAASNMDLSVGSYFTKTISGATTFTVSNIPASRYVSWALKLTNGGSATVTWPAGTKWTGGVAPTLTTTGVDLINFITDDGGTTIYAVLAGKGMA